MHSHLEIVMPPTNDIPKAVESILAQFDEYDADNHNSFWDFWVIGGRWAGTKHMARYDEAKIQKFMDWCKAEKITVSGLVSGKEELSPASQIPKVDAKWQEMFPSSPPIPCPIFRHSNDQYGRGDRATLPDDVAPLGDVARTFKMSRIIIAMPPWRSDPSEEPEPPSAEFMLTDTEWNGCNHMPIAWDGTLGAALAMYQDKLKYSHNEAYKAHATPKDDWLVVTVDYHS